MNDKPARDGATIATEKPDSRSQGRDRRSKVRDVDTEHRGSVTPKRKGDHCDVRDDILASIAEIDDISIPLQSIDCTLSKILANLDLTATTLARNTQVIAEAVAHVKEDLQIKG